MVWNIVAFVVEFDPAALDEIMAQFGHVNAGGRMTGYSTGNGQLRIHFIDEPGDQDAEIVAGLLGVNYVEIGPD